MSVENFSSWVNPISSLSHLLQQGYGALSHHYHRPDVVEEYQVGASVFIGQGITCEAGDSIEQQAQDAWETLNKTDPNNVIARWSSSGEAVAALRKQKNWLVSCEGASTHKTRASLENARQMAKTLAAQGSYGAAHDVLSYGLAEFAVFPKYSPTPEKILPLATLGFQLALKVEEEENAEYWTQKIKEVDPNSRETALALAQLAMVKLFLDPSARRSEDQAEALLQQARTIVDDEALLQEALSSLPVERWTAAHIAQQNKALEDNAGSSFIAFATVAVAVGGLTIIARKNPTSTVGLMPTIGTTLTLTSIGTRAAADLWAYGGLVWDRYQMGDLAEEHQAQDFFEKRLQVFTREGTLDPGLMHQKRILAARASVAPFVNSCNLAATFAMLPNFVSNLLRLGPSHMTNFGRALLATSMHVGQDPESLSHINLAEYAEVWDESDWKSLTVAMGAFLALGALAVKYPQTEPLFESIFSYVVMDAHWERSKSSARLWQAENLEEAEAIREELGGSLGELSLFLAIAGGAQLLVAGLEHFPRTAQYLANFLPRTRTGQLNTELVGALACLPDDIGPPIVKAMPAGEEGAGAAQEGLACLSEEAHFSESKNNCETQEDEEGPVFTPSLASLPAGPIRDAD